MCLHNFLMGLFQTCLTKKVNFSSQWANWPLKLSLFLLPGFTRTFLALHLFPLSSTYQVAHWKGIRRPLGDESCHRGACLTLGFGHLLAGGWKLCCSFCKLSPPVLWCFQITATIFPLFNFHLCTCFSFHTSQFSKGTRASGGTLASISSQASGTQVRRVQAMLRLVSIWAAKVGAYLLTK